jgi:hypothetical protein
MMRGVAAIAERDQVRRFIDPTRGTGDQMMDVGFTPRAGFTASLAVVAISCKYNASHFAPSVVLLLGRVVVSCQRQVGLPRQAGLANATWPVARELGLLTTVRAMTLRVRREERITSHCHTPECGCEGASQGTAA